MSEKKRKRKTDYTLDEIIRALKKNKGNITKTAKELGMSRNNFYRMKKKMEEKITRD
jgi:transcriptional regulator of acetoin/glycerol metabolism